MMNGVDFDLQDHQERGGRGGLLTGLIAFGICLALARGATMAAVAFGVTAAMAAALLDTLYFHLLFLLREAPVHAAEKHYQRALEEARRRLLDGSIRLKEALIRRFEADYRRSAGGLAPRRTHAAAGARGAAAAQGAALDGRAGDPGQRTGRRDRPGGVGSRTCWRTGPDYVDALVDARMQVQRRGTVLDHVHQFFPAGAAGAADAGGVGSVRAAARHPLEESP